MSEFGEKEIVGQGITLEELKKGLQAIVNNQVVIAELEKIKEEIENLLSSYGYLDMHTNNDVLEIIDNHIAELKGE